MHLNTFSISGLAVFLTCFSLAVFILIYGKTKLQRIWALFNIAVGIWGFGCFLIGKAPTESTALISWKIAQIGAIFISVLFFHVVCVFCEIPRRKIIIAAYLQALFFAALLPANILFSRVRFVFNSFYYFIATPFYYTLFIIWISLVIWGHCELFRFYKRAKGSKKNQALYLFIGMLIGFLGGGSHFLPIFYIDLSFVGNFTIPIYCVITSYAILRHHLMDIEVVIKKTLLYSILISLITIIYFIIVYLLERIFCVIAGYRSIASAVTIIALFSIIFTPLKNKVQRAIDKYFFTGTIDQIEKENVLLGAELQRSERLKAVSTLAAGMAHEIKNPLTSIKTFVEFMDAKYKDADFRQKFKKIVPKEIDKISNIINQLLDYSRTEKASLKMCNIHNILDYVGDLYNSVFIKKHIKVQKIYNLNNPKIVCDENQMKQVFINIILNSIEAMPDGGNIVIKTEAIDGDPLEISLRDDGIGIPKEKIVRLFDPFYTTKEKGAGLGLYIVYQIIQNNKAKIAIESDIGRGTIVKIRFKKKT